MIRLKNWSLALARPSSAKQNRRSNDRRFRLSIAMRLVNASVGVPKPFDFVLHMQLAAFQLGNFQVVGVGTRTLAFDFPLQCSVLALESGQLRMPVHWYHLSLVQGSIAVMCHDGAAKSIKGGFRGAITHYRYGNSAIPCGRASPARYSPAGCRDDAVYGGQ